MLHTQIPYGMLDSSKETRMAVRVLYLFPDTNVFIQCRPLEDLNWSEWEGFEEVHLLVCRTVQREIDRQKSRGNDRVGQRARKYSSLFGDIVQSDTGYLQIRESHPKVKLLIDPAAKPNPCLVYRLDYSKPDDEIVGFAYSYKLLYPDTDVRLVTNDAGPMMTAKTLDLPFERVREDWLLQPESNPLERKNAQLKSEIARLKKTEPSLRVRCEDSSGNEVKSLEFETTVYEPLTNSEISELVKGLRSQFPQATDFGSREPAERASPFPISGFRERYVPSSEQEIAKYKNQDYPAWIKECEETFRNLHEALQKQAGLPSFRFVAANEGTRPGKDVLVEIVARGNIKIRPPQGKYEEESEESEPSALRLPPPPRPPRGHWSNPLFESFGNVQRNLAWANSLSNPAAAFAPFQNPIKPSRDRNAFYYKPILPEEPVGAFSLECEQWRHGGVEEYFDGEIFFEGTSEEVKGAVVCQIHAENVSDPVKKNVPVKGHIIKGITIDQAHILIAEIGRR